MNYLITEKQYNWVFEQNNQAQLPKLQTRFAAPTDYLGKGAGFEQEKKAMYGDPQTMTLVIGKRKGTKLEEAMESFRDGLFTPEGVAISAFLTSFGWGAPVVATSFAALLAWDIYKSVNGDTDWLNIIVDTFSLLTSGALSGVFAPILKGAGKGFTSIAKVFEYLKTTNVWKVIQPYLKTIVNGLSSVGKFIVEGIKWLAKNTGISFLLQVSNKILGFLTRVTSDIMKFIGTGTSKVVQQITKSASVGKASGSAAQNYVAATGLEKIPGVSQTKVSPPKVQLTNQQMQDLYKKETEDINSLQAMIDNAKKS